MGLMGVSTMKVAVDSQVKWGNTRMRVALVLDNTGSMADAGKMPALITATNNLLTQLKSAAANPGDVYVSIIPFVKDVNIGSSNYNATWIDWTDWSAEPPWNLVSNKPSGWDQDNAGDNCPFTNSSWLASVALPIRRALRRPRTFRRAAPIADISAQAPTTATRWLPSLEAVIQWLLHTSA